MKKFIILSAALTLAACTNEAEEEQTDQQENQVEEEQSVSAPEPKEEDLVSQVNGFSMYENTDLMKNVQAVEDAIRSEWEAKDFTIDNPLVVLDPYDVTPLSAFVAFETKYPATVTYRVLGKTEDATISNTINEPKTIHEIPVLGLYPGYKNTVEIELTDQYGQTISQEVEISTENLPDGYWDLELHESQPEHMHPGLTFLNVSGGEYAAVDHNGEVRFLLAPWMANNVEHLDNGNIAIALRRAHDPQDARVVMYDHIVEMDLLGKPYNSYIFDIEINESSVPLDHDIIELDNGNMLVLAHDGDSIYEEDAMFEFDMSTGEIVQETDFKDLFPADYYEDYYFEGEESYDWLHHNSIYQTADGQSLLVSGRNHDLVFKMTYPELEMEWIMTTDDNWEETTRPDDYLLEPIGEGKFQMAQHAVEEMPDQDGNPNTMDIMLFDNNRYIMRGDEDEAHNYSRAVQYRIDELNMTVEEIWSYGEERGEYSYSDIVSDADYLVESNNVLINFGRAYNEDDMPVSQIVEVDKATNEVLFEYHVTQTDDSDRRQVYRADRLPLYAENYRFTGIIDLEELTE